MISDESTPVIRNITLSSQTTLILYAPDEN